MLLRRFLLTLFSAIGGV